MSVFVLIIWVGGMNAAPNKIGFWRTIWWPYYAAKSFARQFAYGKETP